MQKRRPRLLQEHFGIRAGEWETQDRTWTAAELEDGFAGLAPAVVELPSGEALAVPLDGWLVTPRGPRKIPFRTLRTLWEEPLRTQQRELFASLPLGAANTNRVISRLIRPLPAARVIAFQTPASAPFAAQLTGTGFFWRALFALVAHGLAYALMLAAWALIGSAALSGRWDEGWFWGWGILLAASVPLDAWAEWQQGWLATAFGGLLKQRLLASSLNTDPDHIRSRGAGSLLSRVFESDALEGSSLAGGTVGIVSLIEIMMSLGVDPHGKPASIDDSLCSRAWLGVVALMAIRFFKSRRPWMLARLELTSRLAENMSGHRTRISQQPAALWHRREDHDLADYEKAFRKDGQVVGGADRSWTSGLAGGRFRCAVRWLPARRKLTGIHRPDNGRGAAWLSRLAQAYVGNRPAVGCRTELAASARVGRYKSAHSRSRAGIGKIRRGGADGAEHVASLIPGVMLFFPE